MSKISALIEYITQDIIEYIITDTGVELDEAMRRFYNSVTFEKLQDTQTGLYTQSSAYVYEVYRSEVEYGRITQEQ